MLLSLCEWIEYSIDLTKPISYSVYRLYLSYLSYLCYLCSVNYNVSRSARNRCAVRQKKSFFPIFLTELVLTVTTHRTARNRQIDGQTDRHRPTFYIQYSLLPTEVGV